MWPEALEAMPLSLGLTSKGTTLAFNTTETPSLLLLKPHGPQLGSVLPHGLFRAAGCFAALMLATGAQERRLLETTSIINWIAA